MAWFIGVLEKSLPLLLVHNPPTMPGDGEEYPTGVIGPSLSIGIEFGGTLEKDLLLLLQPLLEIPTGECMVGIGGEKGLPEVLGRDTNPGLPRGLGDMN